MLSSSVTVDKFLFFFFFLFLPFFSFPTSPSFNFSICKIRMVLVLTSQVLGWLNQLIQVKPDEVAANTTILPIFLFLATARLIVQYYVYQRQTCPLKTRLFFHTANHFPISLNLCTEIESFVLNGNSNVSHREIWSCAPSILFKHPCLHVWLLSKNAFPFFIFGTSPNHILKA